MPRLPMFPALLSILALMGCGPGSGPLRLDARHPADPRAPEGPPPAAWVALRADRFDQAATADRPEAGAARDSTMLEQDKRSSAVHHGHGSGPKATAPAASGPPPGAQGSARDQASPATRYACPMHHEVTDTKPSECPKCGMTLVRQKEKP